MSKSCHMVLVLKEWLTAYRRRDCRPETATSLECVPRSYVYTLRKAARESARLRPLGWESEVRDVIGVVLAGDELERVGYALDEVGFPDQRRNAVPLVRKV